MSETGDLLAVVGELDRELVRLQAEDTEGAEVAREAAATLIPALRDPDTLGWYDRFLAATDATPRDTDLATAVRSLSAPTASAAMVARRLVATGAVARALAPFRPDAEGDERDAVLLALSGPGILAGGPTIDDVETPSVIQDNAPLLHELLMDRDALPDAGSLRDFLHGPANGLLQDAILRAPLPCSSVVVPVVTADGIQVALAVITEVCVAGTTFEQATSENGLLNPVRWAQSAFWCEMTPAPGQQAAPWDGSRRFLERVALDCDPPEVFPVAVWLDFSARWVNANGQKASRQYRMASEQPAPANGAVSIDDGSLVVQREGDHVRMTTTKRVEFTDGVEEPALSVLACAVGYGALAAEFALLGLGDEATARDCTGGGDVGDLGDHAHAGGEDAGGPAHAGGEDIGEQPGAGGEDLGEHVHAGGQASTTSMTHSLPPIDPVDEPLRALVETAGACAGAAGDVLADAAAGKLTGARLAGEVARSVRRAVTAAVQLAALAVVVADPPEVLVQVEAGPFSGAAALPRCRPEARPLQSGFGDVLEPERIRFARDGHDLAPGEPLDPGSAPFSLRVRTGGLPPGHYNGQVDLVEVDGAQTHAVAVDVLVP